MYLYEMAFYFFLYAYVIFVFFYFVGKALKGFQTNFGTPIAVMQIGIRDELFFNFDDVFAEIGLYKID